MKRLLTFSLALLFAFIAFNGCEEDEPTGPGATPETASALYVLNGSGYTISMVDLETGTIYNNQVNVGEWPQGIYYYNDKIYQISTKFDNIDIIDPDEWTLGTAIELGDGNSPEFMAFIDETTAYITCDASDKIMKLNLSTGAVVDEIDVGLAPWGILYYEGMLYVMNTAYDGSTYTYGQGTVTVINVSTDAVVATINVGTNPQWASVDANGLIHVACTGNYLDVPGVISVIDPATNTVTDELAIGGSPGIVEMSPDGSTAYVTSWGVGLAVYDTETLTIINSFDDPLAPGSGAGLIVGPQGEVFTSNSTDNEVYELDEEGNIIATYSVGSGPTNLALKTSQE